MRFTVVSENRFYDIMERCGAYLGEVDKGQGHRKELWIRHLSDWQGPTVVGTRTYMQGCAVMFSVAGYLADYYK